MTALLSTTYFGPVQWYQKLCRYDRVLIDRQEPFVKQTYRNRCLIATANGVQALTVPVQHTETINYPLSTINFLRISNHGNWRHQHWQAITSAYGDSPFLEYYEDDLRPFFFEQRWEYLHDFNEDIRRTMCRLIDIQPHVELAPRLSGDSGDSRDSGLSGNSGNSSDISDFRHAINPKHPAADPDFTPRPYYQVFSRRHGFLPNLSILDLLLNMGPEAIFWLYPLHNSKIRCTTCIGSPLGCSMS